MTFQKETITQAIQSTSAVQIVHVTIANIYTAAKDSVRKEGITMDVKEKLVEIMEDLSCNDEYCKNCEFCNDIEGCVHRQKEIIADRLIANGVTVQEWISVKDKLPEKDGQYLIFTTQYFTPDHIDEIDHKDGIEISGYCKRYGFLSENGLHAKYWRDIPQPPKGE